MRFSLEGLEVVFPYDYIYPEQVEYMRHLKACLDGQGGHCLLEMPTGTGKTVTLLSFVLSYQAEHPGQVGKLVYCTRTVQEMDKVVEELRLVIAARVRYAAEDAAGAAPAAAAAAGERPVLGVCLSSRRNMCVHPEVSRFENRGRVDALCRNRTAGFVRERKEEGGAEAADVELCDFYEGFMDGGSDASLAGIYSLEDMKELGKRKTWCPYYLARHLISLAGVVVYNYQYMLDPKIANMVSREIEKESIVVFDEAHNIDNVCIEALSVTLSRQTLQASSQNVARLSREIRRMEQSDAQRLNDEYQNLVRGLVASGSFGAAGLAGRRAAAPEEEDDPPDDDMNGGGGGGGGGGSAAASAGSGSRAAEELLAANPVLDADILREAMPGSIRRARNFARFMRTLIEYLKGVMRGRQVTQESPGSFVRGFEVAARLQDTRALQFTYDRLASLLRTLRVTDADEFTPLAQVANFASLVSTYSEGFTCLFEPYDRQAPNIPDPMLQLCCLDASLAIRPVFERFRSVIITSGTLSPLSVYPKILSFVPKVSASLPMSLTRECICPMVVTKGSDQVPITSRFEQRGDGTVLQNYGRLLVEMAAAVPDGMVCFFTSYRYMEEAVSKWDEWGILQEIMQHKLIFIETKDIVETTMALDAYKKACDCGRGAVFFSIARGKVAEGIDFDRHYGRAVLICGVPFQYTLSRVLHARLVYLRETFNLNEGEFLSFDALRQASQCVGRVIRSKSDYGIMVFADVRYSRQDKRRKLPQWIQARMLDSNTNLSTDRAVSVSREFLRQMAQPATADDNLGITMLNQEQAERLGRGGGKDEAASSSSAADVVMSS